MAGCISNCRLHADYHEPHDPGWKYLLSFVSETDIMDDLDLTPRYWEMARAQTHVTIPPRSSAKMLHQSLPIKTHLVAPRRSHRLEFDRLGCVRSTQCRYNVLFASQYKAPANAAQKIGNSTITSLPHGARILDGLFQAFAVRSGGFYVVPIANLRIGLLILYVIMMYISVYPVVITMRNSNVYEERSLGVYADDPQPASQPPLVDAVNGSGKGLQRSNTFATIRRVLSSSPKNSNNTPLGSGGQESGSYFVRQQLRGQLAHDIWWIVLAVLFISITETSQFESDPVDYSVFNVLFEVVSAYGCVGISVGLPNVAYSFCGGWHTLSKLILCAVMLRGRHRGLPVAIDRAVLLPGEHLALAEEEDARIRADRTRAGADGGGSGGTAV